MTSDLRRATSREVRTPGGRVWNRIAKPEFPCPICGGVVTHAYSDAVTQDIRWFCETHQGFDLAQDYVT